MTRRVDFYSSNIELSASSVPRWAGVLELLRRRMMAELPSCPPPSPPHLSPTGLPENSLDSLVFESLIPKPILQRYVSLLTEHRRIILSGPSGTGKTYLANRLSEYVVLREGRELTDGVIATFNVDHKSSKVRRSSCAGCTLGSLNAADTTTLSLSKLSILESQERSSKWGL